MAESTDNIVKLEDVGGAFTIDASHAPEYVLVSGYGLFDVDVFRRVRESLIQVMDAIVGEGRRFCPVIFDMSCGRPDRTVNIPDLRQAESRLMRRYDRVILVYEAEKDTVFDFFVTLFTALAPQTEKVSTLEEAIQKLSG